MQEEDDWQPPMTAESILKAKIINFSNEIITQNLEFYNSKPTPHQDIESSSQQGQNQQKMQQEQPETKNTLLLQNLYDPLNDEDEEEWVSKTLLKSQGYMRPLSCPGCFTPLCYSYDEIHDEQGQYVAKQIVNCNYNPYPIQSNPNPSSNLAKSKIQKDVDLQKMRQALQKQQMSIDLKFELICTECENVVGFYEAQKNHYRLIGLI